MKSILTTILFLCLCLNYALSDLECDSSCLSNQCLIPNDPNYCLECPGIAELGEALSRRLSSNENKKMNRNLGEKWGNFDNSLTVIQNSIKNRKNALNSGSNQFEDLGEGSEENSFIHTVNNKTIRRLEDSGLTNNQIVLLILGLDTSSFRGYGACAPIEYCFSPNIIIQRLNATPYCLNVMSAESIINNILNLFEYVLGIMFPINDSQDNTFVNNLFQAFANLTEGVLPSSLLNNSPYINELLLAIFENNDITISDILAQLESLLNDQSFADYINSYLAGLLAENSELISIDMINLLSSMSLEEIMSMFTIPQIYYNLEPNSANQIGIQINNSVPYFDVSFNVDALLVSEIEAIVMEYLSPIMSYLNISQYIEMLPMTLNTSISFRIGCKDLVITISEINTAIPIPLQYEYVVQNFTNNFYYSGYADIIYLVAQEIFELLKDLNITIPEPFSQIPQLFIAESEFNFSYALPIPPIPIYNQSGTIGINLQLLIDKTNVIDNCGLCKFKNRSLCENLVGICYANNYLQYNTPEEDISGYNKFLIRSPTCLKNVGSYCLNKSIEMKTNNVTWNECKLFFSPDEYLIAMNSSRILEENLSISYDTLNGAINPILEIPINASIDILGSHLCSDYIMFLTASNKTEILDIPNDKCLIKRKNLYDEDISRRDSILYLTFDPTIRLEFGVIAFKQNMIIDNIFMLPLNKLPQINIKVNDLQIEFPSTTGSKSAKCMPLKGSLTNFASSIYHNVEYYVPNPTNESNLYKINAQLKSFNNQNSFIIPSELTSAIESLDIHVKYNILNHEKVTDINSTINFVNSDSPLVISKILYNDVDLDTEIIEDYIHFYNISECNQTTNMTPITKFTIQVKSYNYSNGDITDVPTLANNYTNSLMKYSKILFDPANLPVGFYYNVSIQPLDDNSTAYNVSPSLIRVYVMNPRPRVEIICPPIVSNQVGILELKTQIYPSSYYDANKDSLDYNWICFDLNISARNVSLNINNLHKAVTNYAYSCSVQVLKNGFIETFNETSFQVFDFPLKYISTNVSNIQNNLNKISISVPMDDPNYDLEYFSWVLAEVRNETHVFGSINDTLNQILNTQIYKDNNDTNKSQEVSQFNHASNMMENLELQSNSQDPLTNLIPDELNILKGAFKYPFNLIFDKKAKYSGYSFVILFFSKDITGNNSIWPIKITIPYTLNNALLLPSSFTYVKDEDISFNIFNPGFFNPNKFPLLYSLERQDCPLTENNFRTPLITKFQSFQEIALKTYLGSSKCNFLIRIYLDQILGFSIKSNYVDIYIAPKNFNTSNPPVHYDPPPIDFNDSKSRIENSTDIIISIYDPVAQMLEILNLEKNVFNNFNSTELEGKSQASDEYQKFNDLLSLITDLIAEVLDNIANLKASKKDGKITDQEYYVYDSAINIGLLIINDITNKGSTFITNTNKIELVSQLEEMASNIHFIQNVPQVSTLPQTIDNILSESKNPKLNYETEEMEIEDSIYINAVMKELLGVYAMSLTTDNSVNSSQGEDMNSTIIRQPLSSYSTTEQSFNISSNSENFELSIPSSQELLQSIVEGLKLTPTQTPIANYLFTLTNGSKLSNDSDFEANIQLTSKDQVYLNDTVDLETLNDQVSKALKDKSLRAKFAPTLRLGINIMVSKVQSGVESSTGKWLNLCDIAGKSIKFTLIDKSGPKGIKIPVFISSTGSISSQGMKVTNYDSVTKKLNIEWTVPSCGKLRMLADSSNGINVFAYSNPDFNPNNSSLLGFSIKYTMLWLSIAMIGAGLIFYIIQSDLNILNKREYIVKACSSSKYISSILNKAPPEGFMKEIRLDRLRNIFCTFSGQKIHPESKPSMTIIQFNSLSNLEDRSLNYLKRDEEIIVDPNQFMDNEQTNLMAVSICDFERETRSSSLWQYILDEHLLTCLFFGKNIRYPSQFKAADFVSSLIFLLFISGIFSIFTDVNFVLFALFSALCNLPLSLLSKKLLIGQIYNLKMSQEEANKIITGNKKMALVAILLNIIRSIGGLIAILLISMFKLDLFDTLMKWVYGYLVSLAFDVFGFELIKIFTQIILIKMTKIKMQNGETNFIRNLVAI